MTDYYEWNSKPPMWEIKQVNEPQYVEFNVGEDDEKVVILKEYIWCIEKVGGRVCVHFITGKNIYVTGTYEEVLKKMNICL